MNVNDKFILIQTKLYRPLLPIDLVPRPQLTEWLDERRKRPLTLVSAPAGYGKSTLISSWLDTCKYANAWLTLDEQDNDLMVFLTYFLEAIHSIFPNAAQHTQALLNAQTPPPGKELAIHLVNEINQIDQFFVLVLDDYEVIRNNAIHDLLNQLLIYPSRNMHLVLCTRIDPMISLVNLRAQGQLNEIRAQDLCFTEEETQILLQNMLGTSVDMAAVQFMEEQTEGWVTGLRLAALALRHRIGKQKIEVLPTPNNKYVSDYLMSEILDNQVASFSEWLLKTSILERFNPGLCEAVCLDERAELSQPEGAPQLDGEGFLTWLVDSNLFAIPLDDYNQWIRYHHLFREFLRTELGRRYDQTEICALHIRASEWFEQQGLMDEALQHALEAGDLHLAAQLVEQNGPALLDEDKWYVLERWLAKLPDDIIQQRAKLLLIKAWVLFYHFALPGIPALLESVEAILDVEASTLGLWGEVDFFWGHHWFWQGQNARSLEHFHHALGRIPKSFYVARGHTELFWGAASQMAGHKKEAIEALNKWLYQEESPHPTRRSRLEGALIFIHLLSGELVEAARMAQQLQATATKYNNTYARAWGSYLYGFAHYFWNDLETAVQHFAQAVELRYNLHSRAAIDSLAGLTHAYQALGQTDKARATLALLLEFTQDINDPAYLSVARSCQAHLALLQGDMISAVRWLQAGYLTSDASVMFFWIELSRITRCRVLIAQGTEDSLQQALDLLQENRQTLEAQYNTRQLIDVLVLQALAYKKGSQTEQAMAALERAITLAEPGEWIRPFVEAGSEIVPMLSRYVDQQGSTSYTYKLLADCKTEVGTEVEISIPPTAQLIEPLTNRESEILELLGKRLTNKEIAAELYISVGTVQQHLNHIYAKLNVKGRRQAIAKAAELALLPSQKKPQQ